MGGSCNTPGRNRDGITELGAEPVHKPAESEQTNSICELESRVDPAKLFVCPTDLLIQSLFQERKDLPVNVIDGSGEKQQSADHPSKFVTNRGFCSARRKIVRFRRCSPFHFANSLSDSTEPKNVRTLPARPRHSLALAHTSGLRK